MSFEDFIGLMQQVENKIMHNNNNTGSEEAPSSIKKEKFMTSQGFNPAASQGAVTS